MMSRYNPCNDSDITLVINNINDRIKIKTFNVKNLIKKSLNVFGMDGVELNLIPHEFSDMKILG